jgi:hypothetical protein
MPKRSSTARRDENQTAFDVLQQVIRETEGTGKNPAAVALGRKGGLKGGPARRDRLSATRRKQIAAKAARSRWAKPGKA